MDPIYYFIIGLLLVLSCFDLVVGVSNDAANFLNSAIGSRVAKRRTIVLIAAVGVLLGSLFSSGMMEIARSGVFMPAQFYFHDVMMIFLAVMLTDIILLDTFNTFGMPTSTTVSIVFELLGAAVAVALFKMWSGAPGVATEIGAYINSSKALAIISGIFSSVVIAMICGLIIMWFSRLIFSYHYKKSFKYIGPLWCGIALTAITYFAVFKGLKGCAFMTKDMLKAIDAQIWMYVAYALVIWTVLMGICQWLFRINILKIAVLAGTMSLAFAFAGNDLVNFIGVFMAGSESLSIAEGVHAAGGDISTLSMGELAAPVVADWRYLLGAGVIMVLALMFSRKARTVSETEVNLARQSAGTERFGSAPPARLIVRYALQLHKAVDKVLPKPVGAFIERRFQPLPEGPENGAPFDLIRASVNLTVAALLISLATSLKLPLSTTYVTFMVAMGSSLADRAWGRDSAVYRITGVMTVISGWFFTAFAAFSAAFIVAMAIVYGGLTAIILVCALVVYILIRSAIYHRKKEHAKAEHSKTNFYAQEGAKAYALEIVATMQRMTDILDHDFDALHAEDRSGLKKLRKETRAIKRSLNDKLALEVVPSVKSQGGNESLANRGKRCVQVMEYARAAFESVAIIANVNFMYIDNNHEGLGEELIAELKKLNGQVASLFNSLRLMIEGNNFEGLDDILKQMDALDEESAEMVKQHIVLKDDDVTDMRRQILYLNLLNETRSMVRKSYLLAKAERAYLLS